MGACGSDDRIALQCPQLSSRRPRMGGIHASDAPGRAELVVCCGGTLNPSFESNAAARSAPPSFRIPADTCSPPNLIWRRPDWPGSKKSIWRRREAKAKTPQDIKSCHDHINDGLLRVLLRCGRYPVHAGGMIFDTTPNTCRGPFSAIVPTQFRFGNAALTISQIRRCPSAKERLDKSACRTSRRFEFQHFRKPGFVNAGSQTLGRPILKMDP